jgi:hypothetical protein
MSILPRSRLATAGLVVLLLLLVLPGASVYYSSSSKGRSCTRCHEITPQYNLWISASHRSVTCEQCHGGPATLDASFHLNNLHRLVNHMRGEVPEQVKLRNIDIPAMIERCRQCHRQEFAQWQSGPHSATYQRIFLDKEHNTKRPLMDDCLRCHGMHYEGGIASLVAPLSMKGPWTLKPAGIAAQPAIPCLACHQMHREGAPLQKKGVEGRVAGAEQEINRPSLGLFDRRGVRHIAVARLPMPAVFEGARRVKISPDQRQALCYQCHAPEVTMQVNSGDDRTPIGVHEGMSCLACHEKHGQKTRASCANCHPRLSNCGLDVEKMDTTFRSAESKHNIHFVKCVDCHPKGVPKKRRGETL